MKDNEKSLLSSALGTLQGVALDYSGPMYSAASLELIGKWVVARRILAELIYGDSIKHTGHMFALPFEEDADIEIAFAHNPSSQGTAINEKELELVKNVLALSQNFGGSSDSADACLRVFRRQLAELAGEDLTKYRLLFEKEVSPKYFKQS